MTTQNNLDTGIAGIHHDSMVATDPVKVRAFYGDKLGLREIPSPSTFNFPVVWYQVGEQQIHLMIKDQPDPVSPRHVALSLKDAQAARQALKARGVEIRETTEIPGADRFFVFDPDGNRIEMVEWKIPWGEGPM